MLADPYLLGISSGASSGAAAAILFGALAASMLVFLVARSGGRVTSIRMLLAGVAVGYALSGLTSFLVFASGSAEGARSVLFRLLGSLGLAQLMTASGGCCRSRRPGRSSRPRTCCATAGSSTSR